MIRIVVLGDLNLDIHARLPEDLAVGDEAREEVIVRPGGSAGTFARTAARLGSSVTFLGAVGSDPVGDLLEASLGQAGVRPALLRSDRASGAVLAILKNGERSMVCSRGANDALSEHHVATSFPDGQDHLHVSGYALLADGQRKAALRAFTIAAGRGMSISVDPPPAGLLRAFGPQQFLALIPETAWLFPNVSEAVCLSGQQDIPLILDALALRFPAGALTMGKDGATAWRGGRRHRALVAPIASVDPTGAGDTFAAAFVVEFLGSGDIARATVAGCSAATGMLQGRLGRGA